MKHGSDRAVFVGWQAGLSPLCPSDSPHGVGSCPDPGQEQRVAASPAAPATSSTLIDLFSGREA